MKSDRYFFFTSVAIVTVLVLCIALSWVTASRHGRVVEIAELSAEQLTDCATLMQIRFPEGTTPTGFLLHSGKQTQTFLRVRVPRERLHELIDSSRIARAAFRSDPRMIRNEGGLPAWWSPDAILASKSAQTELPDPRQPGTLAILYAEDSADPADVYLVWRGRAQ